MMMLPRIRRKTLSVDPIFLFILRFLLLAVHVTCRSGQGYSDQSVSVAVQYGEGQSGFKVVRFDNIHTNRNLNGPVLIIVDENC